MLVSVVITGGVPNLVFSSEFFSNSKLCIFREIIRMYGGVKYRLGSDGNMDLQGTKILMGHIGATMMLLPWPQ